MLEFLQRFYDRTPVVEQYLQGRLALHIHGRVDRRSYRLSCVRDVVVHMNTRSDDAKFPVLVGIGNFPEVSRPSAVKTWLQPLKCCLVGVIKTTQDTSIVKDKASSDLPAESVSLSLPSIWRIFDRKLRVLLDVSRVENGKFINEVIKCRSQVVDCFPDENAENRWQRLSDVLKDSRGR